MIVNYETLKAAFDGFQALYKEAWSQVVPDWPKIAMQVPSTKASETLDWLGDVPTMREFLGERTLKQLKGYKYTILNKDWESSIEVDRNQFEDDNIGIINPRIQDLPSAYARHCDNLVFALLSAGLNTGSLCYDGTYFFNASHAESGTNQSNYSTAALSQAALEDGFQAMMAFTSDTGVPLGIIPDTLVVGLSIYLYALKLVGSLTTMITQGTTLTTGFLTTGTLNALSQFGIRVIPSPYIGANDWFLLCTKYPIKPLIFQLRRAPEFAALINPTDESVFRAKKFLFGIDARYNVGYGLWQFAYGSTGGS